MAFLDKAGLQNLTNKLVQGDAIKVASPKGTTVKEVIDNIQRECESVALPNNMILENRVNEFKVGQGRNTDVSRDVEEGLSQIQLQGQTYQNLCGSDASCQLTTSLMPHFMIESYNDKIVVSKTNNINEGWRYLRNKTLKSNMIKPNTTYTLFFKYESNFDVKPVVIFMHGDGSQQLSDGCVATKIKDNIYRCVIKTISSFNDKKIGAQVLYFRDATPNKTGEKITLYKDMILLEGDYSQIPINEIPQYFESIKSSFEDKVANINIQGKNLLDYREYSKDYQAIVRPDINGFYFNIKPGTGYGGYIVSILVEPNTIYSLSAERVGEATHTRFEISIKDHEGSKKIFDTFYQSTQRTILTFKTPNQVGSDGKIYLKIWSSIYNNSSYTSNNSMGIANIQLEKGQPTSFEPYYNYNYKFDIKEPLRRLPNGVCDEIRNNNGKWELVRRIGKVVLNGNESWEMFSEKYFRLPQSFIKSNSTNIPLICDKVASVPYLTLDNSIGYGINLSYFLRLNLKEVDIRNGGTIEQLKQLLKTNPLTIYYKLETPIITPIDPIEFNVSQGTTISINSDIPPISTHEVILNRSGQIEQGIELIADLRNRVDKLEKAYDSNLIATQYRLNNLKLNYELEREED